MGGIEPDLPVETSLEESRDIFVALQQDEIPEAYRDEAVAIFDFLRNWPSHPKDPATEHALRALREALPETRG